jgi:hypothetical protein
LHFKSWNPPSIQKDQSKRIGLFVAGLTEMNLRKNFEGDFKSENSKNKMILLFSETFETQNKGWTK